MPLSALTEWNAFSKYMKEHIAEKGNKYDKYDIRHTVSLAFCVDSIYKYTAEMKATLENKDPMDVGTLMSIAHYCSIIFNRQEEWPFYKGLLTQEVLDEAPTSEV